MIHYFDGGQIEIEHAVFLAADYKRMERDTGCTCFISPPCSLCTHEGHPISLEIMGLDEDGMPLDYNGEMHAADIAAIDDTSLTPSQRRHWDAMEAKQAAREQLQRDAESKALRERADSLAEAGRAMDRVNQDHGHKLGWLA